jgi:hypothetical protein
MTVNRPFEPRGARTQRNTSSDASVIAGRVPRAARLMALAIRFDQLIREAQRGPGLLHAQESAVFEVSADSHLWGRLQDVCRCVGARIEATALAHARSLESPLLGVASLRRRSG